MYQTHSFPEWGSINPQVSDDDSVYVQQTAEELCQLFGDHQDMHRPEYDAPRFAKPKAVKAARALDEQTTNQTVAELCDLVPWAEGDGVDDSIADCGITPTVLATAVYADLVWRRDWATDQLSDDWAGEAFVIVYDAVHYLAELDGEDQ